MAHIPMKRAASRNSANKAFCHLCGLPISGRGKLYHHDQWPRGLHLRVCSQCEKSKLRCDICHIPMAQAASKGICQTCCESVQFCLTCGRPISGSSLVFDGVGPYCHECSLVRQPCDICSAPLTDQRWELSDGRFLCSFCHETAILDKEQAASLFEQMKSVAQNALGMSLNVPTGLALVDRKQLAKIIHSQGQQSRPAGEEALALDAAHTLGLYIRKGMRRGLYIQYGLPRQLFLQVSAHEFAHAWQGENCPILKTTIYHEGFAEWVAYQVIGFYGYTRGQQRMLNRNDLYGKGLRLFQDIYNKDGLVGVIKVCQSTE